MSAPDSSRRAFLGRATLALSGVIGALAGLPVLGALFSPLLRRGERGPAAFVPAADLDELVQGVPRRVELRADVRDAWARQANVALGAAWLLKHDDGRVTAWSAVCPHLGCGVRAREGGGFLCPCHDSAFAADGSVRSGPSPRGMDPLEVEVKSARVHVRPARFRLGTKGREEV